MSAALETREGKKMDFFLYNLERVFGSTDT